MRTLLFVLAGLTFSCGATDELNIESKLTGKWTAKAFDGELHEEWTLGTKGWMEQEGYYIEKNDTAYAARTQIQQVGSDIILLSVIKNSNPKIFKATSVKENEIIFFNDDYNSPFQVTYEFISQNQYKRTIYTTENDSLVVYTFDFVKLRR